VVAVGCAAVSLLIVGAVVQRLQSMGQRESTRGYADASGRLPIQVSRPLPC
jgi:hypothetical protein